MGRGSAGGLGAGFSRGKNVGIINRWASAFNVGLRAYPAVDKRTGKRYYSIRDMRGREINASRTVDQAIQTIRRQAIALGRI